MARDRDGGLNVSGRAWQEDGTLSAAGAVSFSDIDLLDTHGASFVAAAGNTTSLGTFALDPVNEAANAASGSVGWHYTLNNTAAQYLADGQSVQETYTVTLDDGHGSTTTQDVVVTITGTNDAVSITSGAQSGTVTEDAHTTPSLTDSLSATGTISFNDVDLSDGHTASFAAAAGNTTLQAVIADQLTVVATNDPALGVLAGLDPNASTSQVSDAAIQIAQLIHDGHATAATVMADIDNALAGNPAATAMLDLADLADARGDAAAAAELRAHVGLAVA